MRWYQNLYLGQSAALNIRKIRQKAAQGKWMAGVYYVTLPSSADNLLDIFHSGMLKQSIFAGCQRMDIVGVAEGKTEALELVQRIIGEMYERTGDFDTVSFFPEEDFQAD